jgi:hypothetical protein
VNGSTRIAALLVLVVLAGVAGAAFVHQTGERPVHVERTSCETGAGVSCEATLVNTDDETGYNLAVRVIGYDADGDVVTRYTNDGTSDGGGIMDVSAGATGNVTISTSSPEPVAEADVRVVEVEAVEE